MPGEPLTEQEIEKLRDLLAERDRAIDLGAELVESEGFVEEARKVAREEIRSLAGLALRRTQDRATPAELWGEVLADFSTDSEPGEED